MKMLMVIIYTSDDNNSYCNTFTNTITSIIISIREEIEKYYFFVVKKIVII